MSPRERRAGVAGQVASHASHLPERSVVPSADLFGRVVYDYHRDRLRDDPTHLHPDGRVTPADPGWHFREYDRWSALERAATDRVEGRVLDVGCGAGRHARYLQRRGHEVFGVDPSPGAVRTASERGLGDAAVTRLTDLAVAGPFDTALVLDGRVGVRDYPCGMRAALADLCTVTGPDGRAVVDIEDPREVERAEPVDRWSGDDSRRAVYRWPDEGPASYARRWVRVRYGDRTGDWTRLAMLTPAQFRAVVAGTRWRVREVLRDPDDPRYAFVLGK